MGSMDNRARSNVLRRTRCQKSKKNDRFSGGLHCYRHRRSSATGVTNPVIVESIVRAILALERMDTKYSGRLATGTQ